MSNEKIEGEFFDAVQFAPRRWQIVRRSDGVTFRDVETDGQLGLPPQMHLAYYDALANHFIELGKQQREADCPDGQGEVDDHREQVRHWLRVAAGTKDDTFWPAALLHDIVEDSYATVDEVAKWFPDGITPQIVATLTRLDESYGDYIARVAKDPDAKAIKIADLKDNLARMDEAHEHNREKYQKALAVLETSTEREGADA